MITLVIQVLLACMDRIVKFVQKNRKQKANHVMTSNYRENAKMETNALLITLVIQVLLACMDRIVNSAKKNHTTSNFFDKNSVILFMRMI